jgi:type I restriction enzyme S subunit
MGNLIKYKLKELAIGVFDCPHSTPKWTHKGVLVVRNFNVKNGRLTTKDASYTDELNYLERTKRAVPSCGDLILTREAPMGEICMIPENIRCCLGQRVVLIRPDNKKVFPKFLLYKFQSSEIQNQIKMSEGTGSVVSNLRIPAIENLEVSLPEYETQIKFASILSSLDDKIELNRRMNQTLEQMAQALFNHYFVDNIDPNNLPEGWITSSLDKIASFLNGVALQKFPAKNDLTYLPVIKIKELKNGLSGTTEKADINIPAQYIIEDGDVLFSWSGSLEVDLWCHGKGALNQHLFKVSSDQFPKWFYYLWTKEHLQSFKNTAASKATTMGHIQRHHLAEAIVYVPPKNYMEKHDETIRPLIEIIISNRLEIRTLTKIRDTLLPRLISGELDLDVINDESITATKFEKMVLF